MSTVIAKNVQIGTSGTSTDNFTIFQPATPDGTLRIGNGNTGITSSQVALTSAGNVGIGTNSPGYRLDVAAGDTAANFGYAARLRSNATAGAATLQFTNSAVSAENGYIRVTDAGLMSFTDRAQITAAGLFQFNSGYGSVATAYGCRAWVNFNGTGTVAIRASGNVSSITDNGTGDYTVNFTTAMPDANYGVTYCSGEASSTPTNRLGSAGNIASGNFRFLSYNGSGTLQDTTFNSAVVFR